MNPLLNGIDVNTIWTSFIFVFVGYLVGTFIFSRIYLSIFNKGKTTIVKNGKTHDLERFGTSAISAVFGKKFAAIQFFTDMAKPIIVFYAFAIPLSLSNTAFKSSLPGLVLVGAVIGHIWPVWWKFKGGVGVATGVGAAFAINWFAGIIGFMVWLIASAITKNSAFGGVFGTITTVVLISIPSVLTFTPFTYPILHAQAALGMGQYIYSFWVMLAAILFRFRYAYPGIKKDFKRILGK